MKYCYLFVIEEDKQEMFVVIGVRGIDELFVDILENVRYKKEY